MILVNTSPNSVNADIHAVPSVHLTDDKREPLLAYAETQDPTAEILAGVSEGSDAPQPPAIAGFSSRGPSLAAQGDLIKPDISAPGVDVLANVPANAQGDQFELMSGTSMSSPHIAGLAALVIDQHPTWSPMAVKSAMMTTASNLTDTVSPFDTGAGHVEPRKFLEPGLVFDSSWTDWANYLAGQGVTYADGTSFSDTPVKASNMNVPSIAINNMAGRESVVRTVTNVSDRTETYNLQAWRLPGAGIKVDMSPKTFSIAPGDTQQVRLTFERTNAPFEEYSTGFIAFVGDTHRARIPVAVRPVAVDAPREVTAAHGQPFTMTTRTGFTGVLTHRQAGLVAPSDQTGTAPNDQGRDFDPSQPERYWRTEFAIQGPLQGIKLETLPERDGDDLDLWVVDANGLLVASSATGSGNETVQLAGLPNGTYTVFVQAWGVQNDEAQARFTLRRWKVGGDPGNMTVSPQRRDVQIARSYTWQGTTSGLAPAKEYLGLVHWKPVPGEVEDSTWVTIK